MLKITIAWLPSWLLYFLGDMASHTLKIEPWEWWSSFWYPIYNRLMLWSSAVQDWAGGNKGFPWEKWADLHDAWKDDEAV